MSRQLKEYQNQWIQNRRLQWIQANGPCQNCGSSERLEVDHVDPSTKSYNPAAIWSRNEEFRLAELAKCQVLCHDCHKDKSDREQRLLSDIHIAEVRSSMLSQRKLAEKYGVSRATIRRAKGLI